MTMGDAFVAAMMESGGSKYLTSLMNFESPIVVGEMMSGKVRITTTSPTFTPSVVRFGIVGGRPCHPTAARVNCVSVLCAIRKSQIGRSVSVSGCPRIDTVRPAHSSAVKLKPTNGPGGQCQSDRKSTRLNSSHQIISYAVFCLQ